jgi:hypothetical protein
VVFAMVLSANTAVHRGVPRLRNSSAELAFDDNASAAAAAASTAGKRDETSTEKLKSSGVRKSVVLRGAEVDLNCNSRRSKRAVVDKKGKF